MMRCDVDGRLSPRPGSRLGNTLKDPPFGSFIIHKALNFRINFIDTADADSQDESKD